MTEERSKELALALTELRVAMDVLLDEVRVLNFAAFSLGEKVRDMLMIIQKACEDTRDEKNTDTPSDA